MFAKVAVLLAVVAVAYGGVAQVVSVPHSPASTVKLANVAPVVTYAAGPAVVAHAPIAYAAAPAPIAYAAAPAPITYAAAPVAIPAPVVYSAPAKVVQTFEPVEQHGYKIAY